VLYACAMLLPALTVAVSLLAEPAPAEKKDDAAPEISAETPKVN